MRDEESTGTHKYLARCSTDTDSITQMCMHNVNIKTINLKAIYFMSCNSFQDFTSENKQNDTTEVQATHKHTYGWQNLLWLFSFGIVFLKLLAHLHTHNIYGILNVKPKFMLKLQINLPFFFLLLLFSLWLLLLSLML